MCAHVCAVQLFLRESYWNHSRELTHCCRHPAAKGSFQALRGFQVLGYEQNPSEVLHFIPMFLARLGVDGAFTGMKPCGLIIQLSLIPPPLPQLGAYTCCVAGTMLNTQLAVPSVTLTMFLLEQSYYEYHFADEKYNPRRLAL